MCDPPVVEAKQVTYSSICPVRIVSTNPWRGLCSLVIDDHDWEALFIQAREVLRYLFWVNCQQSRRQLCCQHAINDLVAVPGQIIVVNSIEDQIIGGLLDALNDAPHEVRNKRPRPGRDDTTNQATALCR